MIRDTFQFISVSRQSIGKGDSARRMGLGVALGMMIGLIPKDSMFTYLIFLVLMISTGNLLCAFVSGFAFNWIGLTLDSFTHKLGGLILTNPQLESAWTWLYGLPLMPWTRFNNTVVMGSLVVALALFVPTFVASHWFFRGWGGAIQKRLQRNGLYRWLVSPVEPDADCEGLPVGKQGIGKSEIEETEINEPTANESKWTRGEAA